MNLKEWLPEESFVNVNLSKIENPEIWIGGENLTSAAWIVSPDADFKGIADRYGGQGNGGATGSGRCVNINGYQIKGCGRTILSARPLHFSIDTCLTVKDHQNFRHTNGVLGLDEAMKEYIFSYAYNQATPYGAVTAHGVILTGQQSPCKYPEDTGHPYIKSALLVRDQCLRLGHYVGIRMANQSQLIELGYVTDTIRTELAVNSFEKLVEYFNIDTSDNNKSDSVFLLFTKRLATQAAWSFIKRLMHSAIGEGNVTIDGKFLDLGVSTQLSDYGNVSVAVGQPYFHQENNRRKEMIYELFFTLSKFSKTQFLTSPGTIIQYFDSVYNTEIENSLLCCLGLPKSMSKQVDQTIKKNLRELFYKILKENKYFPFKLLYSSNNSKPVMPTQMGPYFFSGAICHLSLNNGDPLGIEKFLPIEFGLALSTIYNTLKKCCFNEAYFRLNGLRQNVEFIDLYQPVLNANLSKLAYDDKSSSSNFIKILFKKIDMHLSVENDVFMLHNETQTCNIKLTDAINIKYHLKEFFNYV